MSRCRTYSTEHSPTIPTLIPLDSPSAALAAYSALYGVGREYRFEVVVISINFVVLIIVGLLLAHWFRRGG